MNNRLTVEEPLQFFSSRLKIPTVCSPISSPPQTPHQSFHTCSLLSSPKSLPKQSSTCSLCQKKYNSFTPLISHSLFCKYSSAQNSQLYHFHTKQIQDILQQAVSPAYIRYKDNVFYNEDEENLKRIYNQDEYDKKINMLSQYYKFHRNLPVWNNSGVQQAMNRYYAKLKDVDYKKIKQVLKKQQGISLTTHNSFSSMDDDSQFTKKSRYSTMLNDLQHSNDSIMLRDLCDKIGKALKKIKVEDDFKGTYYSGEKKFEQFMQKQKKRKENKEKPLQFSGENTQKFNFKKLKQKKLHTKGDQIGGLKQIVFASNHSLKEKKYIPLRSIRNNQKQRQNIKIRLKQRQITATNQTNSRQLTNRKQRNRSVNQVGPQSSRNSLSIKDKIQNTHQNATIRQKLKSTKTSLNINLNINQLQKKVNKQDDGFLLEHKRLEIKNKEYFKQNQLKKSNSSQALSKMKSRSNSTHDMKTMSILNNINRESDTKRQLMNSVKINRSSSRKNIPIFVTKGTVIQLGQLKNNNLARQNSQSKSKEKSLSRQKSSRVLSSISVSKLENRLLPQTPCSNKKIINNEAKINLPAQIRPLITPQTPSQPLTHGYTHSQLQVQSSPQYNTSSGTKKPNCEKIFGKKRNSVVENMLEKKLTAFKRKQPIF